MSFSAKNVWLSILYSRPYTIGQSKENSKYSEWFVLQCNTENNKSKISWKFSKTRSKILVSIMFHVSKVARKKKGLVCWDKECYHQRGKQYLK